MKFAPILALAFVAAGNPAAVPAEGDEKITPPRLLKANPSKIEHCYSRYARTTGRMGRVVVTVKLDADAKVTAIDFPPGIETWQEETARCVVAILPFLAGTLGGVPVAAQVQVPINFIIKGSGDVTYLKIAATEEELEAALRACYPADSLSVATPQFRVTVDSNGKPVKIELAESAGDENLDRAGECVLRTIRYLPSKADNRKITSTAIIPVALRPPKQAASAAP